MRKIAGKMKMYASGVSIVNNNNIERRIFNYLLLTIGAMALFYVLLLGNMVFKIVERKTMETQARALGSEVGDLELKYLSLSNTVDLTLSHSMGFKETKATFATRKSLGSIAIAKNEI